MQHSEVEITDSVVMFSFFSSKEDGSVVINTNKGEVSNRRRSCALDSREGPSTYEVENGV